MATSGGALGRLLEVGFRQVGHWELAAGELSYVLEPVLEAKGVLYAFVCDDHVLYVGKSTQTLHRRMYGYKRPGPTQPTNKACHARLRDGLATGKAFRIYCFPSPAKRMHGSFELNLAAGLEDSIIRELRPPWNQLGT